MYLRESTRQLFIKTAVYFTNVPVWTVQVSSVVDKVRRGVAKTIQAASEGEAFDTLPDCDMLATSNRFAIKILPSEEYVFRFVWF